MQYTCSVQLHVYIIQCCTNSALFVQYSTCHYDSYLSPFRMDNKELTAETETESRNKETVDDVTTLEGVNKRQDLPGVTGEGGKDGEEGEREGEGEGVLERGEGGQAEKGDAGGVRREAGEG